MSQVKQFEKEDRYIVIKRTDLNSCGQSTHNRLKQVLDDINHIRQEADKSMLEFVVIESDWSCFRVAWGLVEEEWTKDNSWILQLVNHIMDRVENGFDRSLYVGRDERLKLDAWWTENHIPPGKREYFEGLEIVPVDRDTYLYIG